jgi:hypothetical protein
MSRDKVEEEEEEEENGQRGPGHLFAQCRMESPIDKTRHRVRRVPSFFFCPPPVCIAPF